VLYLIVTGFFTVVPLIVLLALPTFRLVARVYGQPRPASPPPDYPAGAWPLWFVAFAFFHNRRFGLMFLLGLVGDLVLKGVLALVG
jgi:1,4-dihydroxy-2-naphthoate polyprenyltransferase